MPIPTFEDASVKLVKDQNGRVDCAWRSCANLFSIVDLPDEGLPTRPINGSRPISCAVRVSSLMLLRVCCEAAVPFEKSKWDV
jgi:hypothetical protein